MPDEAAAIDRLREKLELELRAAGPDDPGRCFICLRRRDEVEGMFKFPRRHFTVFICDRLRRRDASGRSDGAMKPWVRLPD